VKKLPARNPITKLMPIDIDRAQVESMGEIGLTQLQVAQCLSISPGAWARLCARDPELKAAWERGQSKGVARVASALYEKVGEGNLNAMMFFLRAKGGWSDKPTEGAPIAPVIEITPEDIERVREEFEKLL
jgi:hypothetical protein